MSQNVQNIVDHGPRKDTGFLEEGDKWISLLFNLFKGRSLKMNEKITAAWINIFSVYFDVSADFAAIFKKYTAQVNEKDEFSLQRTETQAQPRDVTQKEREIEVEGNDEESNRESSSSMDTDREGENKYV